MASSDAFLFVPYQGGFEAAGKTITTYVLKVGRIGFAEGVRLMLDLLR